MSRWPWFYSVTLQAGIQNLRCSGWTVRETSSLLDLQRQSEVLMTSILSAAEWLWRRDTATASPVESNRTTPTRSERHTYMFQVENKMFTESPSFLQITVIIPHRLLPCALSFLADLSGSSSPLPVIIGLILGIVFVLAVQAAIFGVWKWRQNRTSKFFRHQSFSHTSPTFNKITLRITRLHKGNCLSFSGKGLKWPCYDIS